MIRFLQNIENWGIYLKTRRKLHILIEKVNNQKISIRNLLSEILMLFVLVTRSQLEINLRPVHTRLRSASASATSTFLFTLRIGCGSRMNRPWPMSLACLRLFQRNGIRKAFEPFFLSEWYHQEMWLGGSFQQFSNKKAKLFWFPNKSSAYAEILYRDEFNCSGVEFQCS